VPLCLAACGPGERPAGDTGGAATPPASPPPAAQQVDPGTITPAMVALGDSIFHGKVPGGICYTCHAENAKGSLTVAPDLTDQTWLHGDGSYGFIIGTVTNGVMQPKESMAPMPPMNTMLNEEQIRAVSAYVYSLSHPGTGGR
jgi:mono/diheme cytochrome c family protein